jgi:hypothetical protein
MVMQVLTLARFDGDLQHPHGVVFKEEAVVCRRGDQRIEMGRPFCVVGLRHVVLQQEAHL